MKGLPRVRNKPSILVLCTGNSARSQIAAGFLELHAGDRFDVHSAGSDPVDAIHPLAIEVMAEKSIEIQGEPRDYRDLLESLEPSYVIIVCDAAARACPVWPGKTERLLWPFDDPAAATGPRADRIAKFREVRDDIEKRVLGWLVVRPSGAV